ncbi:DHA2 family efflux MFS transporter permease subunit [Actinomadura harenae]|uniref:DHA2 family efflux MFS transporter permease subunit n=1 Tax=Actinomadura harenae TaxID=2483351 RepID=A0A3M2LGZ0_9ACTN|nr:DHA2 family efflux MFS transporter permease subunit [Actinomadura harenae]RMI36701.1 DHA2 family efflux MFS transporter permease subunit [Actinomadura harenae]
MPQITKKPDTGTTASAGLTEIPRHVWTVTWVVVFGAFIAALDSSLVNVGLDSIGRDLGVSLTSVQWVASSYLLALGAALPASAWLGQRVGTGRLWMWSLAGFVASSLLCAVSPNLAVLVTARVVQGVTGGLLVPAGQSVIGKVAGPGRIGRVMSTAGLAVVVAPALGPALGGLLIDSLSWRWLFLINLPVGAVALILGWRFLPLERGTRTPLDVRGLALLGVGIPMLSYGVIEAGAPSGLHSAKVLVSLAVGVAAVVGYVLAGRRRENPILSLELFKDKVFSAASAAVFFTGAGLFGGVIIMPLYFEVLRGHDAMETGLLLLSFGAGTALTMRVGGKLTDRFGGGIVATVGLALSAVTTLPFVFMGAGADMILVQAVLLLRGIGLGLAGMPLMSAAFATAPKDLLSHATAEVNILQRVAGALGSAIFVAILSKDGAPDLAAFQTTFLWLTVTLAAGAAVAAWVAVEGRRAKTTTPA